LNKVTGQPASGRVSRPEHGGRGGRREKTPKRNYKKSADVRLESGRRAGQVGEGVQMRPEHLWKVRTRKRPSQFKETTARQAEKDAEC